jgi:hypothetical protein
MIPKKPQQYSSISTMRMGNWDREHKRTTQIVRRVPPSFISWSHLHCHQGTPLLDMITLTLNARWRHELDHDTESVPKHGICLLAPALLGCRRATRRGASGADQHWVWGQFTVTVLTENRIGLLRGSATIHSINHSGLSPSLMLTDIG